MPLGAILLSFLALFYKPQFGQAKDDEKLPLTSDQRTAEEIKDEMKKLQKKARAKALDQVKSRELEKLEEEAEELKAAIRVPDPSHAEISEVLGVSESTIEKHVAKGLVRCRDYLRELGLLDNVETKARSRSVRSVADSGSGE